MFLFGLIAVSVARGQVAPDAIRVFGSTSSNTCVGDGLPREAMNLTQDDNTGNIGIGTCDWSSNLTIQAFAKAKTIVEIVAQNQQGNLPPHALDYLLKVHTLTPAGLAPPGEPGTPASDNPLLVVTDSRQSVGIGIWHPMATLHLNNINASKNIPALWVQNYVGLAPTDALYVDPIGQVGIDNSSPQAALNITNYNDGNGIPALWVQNSNGGSPLDAMYIDVYGNVGIDNETPANTLDVSGTASVSEALYIGSGTTTTNTGQLVLNSTALGDYNYACAVRVLDMNTKAFAVDQFTSSNPDRFVVYGDGRTVIGDFTGVSNPIPNGWTSSNIGGYMLYVNGDVLAQGYKCALTNTSDWSDYVFNKDYKLPDLDHVRSYIEANHHLPEVPSADDVQCDGIDMAKMDATLLKKIEELTLYVLDLKKENTQMKAEIANLKK